MQAVTAATALPSHAHDPSRPKAKQPGASLVSQPPVVGNNCLLSGAHLAGLSGDGFRAVKGPIGWLLVPAPATCRASHDTTRFQPLPDPGDHSNWVLLLRLPQAAVVTQSPQQ